jgi:copper chaperone NosL
VARSSRPSSSRHLEALAARFPAVVPAAKGNVLRSSIEKVNRFLDAPLDVAPRVLLVLAFLCLVPTYLTPLYNMTMFAPQYQDGLRLDIYSYKLVGGNDGQDVKEINVLNHYIGMKDLATADFTEFNWLPFAIGIFGLLFLRAAVLGKTSHLVDVAVLFVYFGLFALWSFGYKMYQYGHHLDPKAAVRVDPFMPPMFGFKKLANFEVYSYPQLGSYALGAAALVLVAALFLAWRQWRRETA